MPDALKDHALLMVTRLDVLQSEGVVEEVSASIQAAAAGEFNRIIPIATRNAIAARVDDGPTNKPACQRWYGPDLGRVEAGRCRGLRPIWPSFCCFRTKRP